MAEAPIDIVNATLAETSRPPSLAAVLDATDKFLRRFIAFPNQNQSAAVTLWIAHAHVIDAAETTGYLHIKSAEKRSGKTRLLEVCELLVPNAIRASTMSPSVMFRLLDRGHRTLLLDEVDAIFSPKADREELRGLLNAGYRRGSCAWRNEVRGSAIVPTAYEAFGAKMLAGIGALPDTIADRCFTVELQRRKADEPIDRFRFREVKQAADELRSNLEGWATEETIAELAAARPTLPNLDDDRALDAWEPLCAIADMAGGQWPGRARRAAQFLHGQGATSEEPNGPATLRAIRDLFDAEPNLDRLPTIRILRTLAQRDDGPWPYWFADDVERWDRDGKPPLKAARKLSKVLESYRVEPRNIKRSDGSVVRGYLRESFGDAWARYLSAPTATPATTATPLASTVAEVAVVAESPPTTDEEAVQNILAAFPGTERLPGLDLEVR